MHTYIVAEIGQNHNGDFELAKRMIDVVAAPIYDGSEVLPGVDAVKFCIRDINTIKNTPSFERLYDSPHSYGKTYKEHRLALEFLPEQYKILGDYAKSKGLDWFASICDVPAVEAMVELGIPKIKVASRDLTNKTLLDAIRGSRRPVWLSTGMSTPLEVENASNAILERLEAILVCTSEYPTRHQNVKLDWIPRFIAKWGQKCSIGWSDHTIGISAPVVAVALGATIVEKHFTLSRSMKGTDHMGSLEPAGMWKMVRDIRNIELGLKPKELLLECELAARHKLRVLEGRSEAQ